MRTRITLAVLGGAFAAALLPAAPASANCIALFEGDTCLNVCIPLEHLYQGADDAAGGALPDRDFACLA